MAQEIDIVALIKGMGPAARAANQEAIRDLEAAIGRSRDKMRYASFGGQGPRSLAGIFESQLPLSPQAYGAVARESAQFQRELSQSMRVIRQQATSGFRGMQWNFPSSVTPPSAASPAAMLALGAIAAPFSPWIASRALSQALPGVGQMFGGGGGGGALGSILGGKGGLSGFLVFYTAIQVASKMLHEFAQAIKGAIDEGAKLYQRSARTGIGMSTLASLGGAFSAIGLSPDILDRMLTAGRIGGKGTRGTVADQIIAAGGGALGAEQITQIRNMNSELTWFIKNTRMASDSMAASAGSATRQSLAWSESASAWKGAWARIMASLEPASVTIANLIGGLGTLADILARFGHFKIGGMDVNLLGGSLWNLGILNGLITGLNKQGQGPGTDRFGGTAQRLSSTSWERMGALIVGGFASSDYSRQIAENTKRTADVLVSRLSSNNSTGLFPKIPNAGSGDMLALFNLP